MLILIARDCGLLPLYILYQENLSGMKGKIKSDDKFFALSTKKRCRLPLSSLHHTLHKVSTYLPSPEFPGFDIVQHNMCLALFPQNDNCCLLSHPGFLHRYS